MKAKHVGYKVGDKVEVKLFWDWEWIWVSGIITKIDSKPNNNKLIFVNTEFGIIESPINNKKLRHKEEVTKAQKCKVKFLTYPSQFEDNI